MITFGSNNEKEKFYVAGENSTLAKRVEQLMSISGSNDISEEVALYRASIYNVVQLFNAAVESEDFSLIDKAADILQNKLRGVADMVKIQAQLESMGREKVSYEQMRTILARILDIINIECSRRGEFDLAERLEEVISDELNMQLNPRGTSLRPDRDVADMIDSVPRLPNAN